MNDKYEIAEEIQVQTHQASREIERAYWWMNSIDLSKAEAIGIAVADIRNVLEALKNVDKLTVEICLIAKSTTDR